MLRNHERNRVLGYHMSLPLTTPTMVELLALKYGLTIAKANNLHPIDIENNSAVLLNMLKTDHPFYHNILTECRQLLEEMQLTVPTKVYREQNIVTDALAKEGARTMHLEPRLFWQIPSFVNDFVQAVREGTTFNRRIKNPTIILPGRDVVLSNISCGSYNS